MLSSLKHLGLPKSELYSLNSAAAIKYDTVLNVTTRHLQGKGDESSEETAIITVNEQTKQR